MINPTAGNGRAGRIGSKVEAAIKSRGVSAQTIYTAYPGHAEVIAHNAVQSGAKTVFVLGGDGTTIEAARGVIHSHTALALIPAGTGNDFRKSFGVPLHWEDALSFALSREPVYVDVGMVNNRPFVNECGAGFDVTTLEYALFSKKFVRGMAAYMYGVIRAMIDNKPIVIKITRENGATETRTVSVFACANGSWIGGGIPIAPMADPRDGLLDVVLIPAMSRISMMGALRQLVKGNVMDIPGAETFRCSEIGIEGKDLKINADGEILPHSHALFRVMPRALRIHA